MKYLHYWATPSLKVRKLTLSSATLDGILKTVVQVDTMFHLRNILLFTASAPSSNTFAKGTDVRQ